MLHVELPHINILSKMDLIEQYGKLGLFDNDAPRLSHLLVSHLILTHHTTIHFFYPLSWSLQPRLLHWSYGPHLPAGSLGCRPFLQEISPSEYKVGRSHPRLQSCVLCASQCAGIVSVLQWNLYATYFNANKKSFNSIYSIYWTRSWITNDFVENLMKTHSHADPFPKWKNLLNHNNCGPPV